MHIKIDLITLKNQRILEVREAVLELNNAYLNYRIDFDCEMPVNDDDPALGWRQETILLNTTFLKKHIATVELSSLPESTKVGLYITCTNGIDIKLFYRRKNIDQAYAMKETITEWLIG
jgi:hypothetical protein